MRVVCPWCGERTEIKITTTHQKCEHCNKEFEYTKAGKKR